eukprot:Hpha_TRINITY_DN16859_c1_g7::TRINITY_DN16859_c1_g7_i1::g.152540::m.152540
MRVLLGVIACVVAGSGAVHNERHVKGLAKDAQSRSNLTETAVASFTQRQCTDSSCSRDCTSHTYEIGKCLLVKGGGSAIVESCGLLTGMVMKSWVLSTTCDGTLVLTTEQPVGRCIEDAQGTYFDNSCSSVASRTTDGAPLRVTNNTNSR